MEWSPEEIRFFVDGINYYTYDPLVQNQETWPFTEDQYLLLNVAMINPVAPNFSRSDMIIDYVRVYQESLGTQNPSIDSDIRIFPNPATSLTNLRLNSEFLGGQIVIYSAQGEIINQLIIQSNLFSIDMSAYPSGIYVMLFSKGDKQVARKIVVE